MTIETLAEIANRAMYIEQGCVDWDMMDYLWRYGYWHWDDSYDDAGNLLDSIKAISYEDLQEALHSLGLTLHITVDGIGL